MVPLGRHQLGWAQNYVFETPTCKYEEKQQQKKQTKQNN